MRKNRRSYVYISPSIGTAERHLRFALSTRVARLGNREFLRAYCSLAYLYPGFHLDSWDDWDGPKHFAPLVREARRRAAAGKLTTNELYPYQASKAAIARASQEAGLR